MKGGRVWLMTGQSVPLVKERSLNYMLIAVGSPSNYNSISLPLALGNIFEKKKSSVNAIVRSVYFERGDYLAPPKNAKSNTQR